MFEDDHLEAQYDNDLGDEPNPMHNNEDDSEDDFWSDEEDELDEDELDEDNIIY